MLCLIDWLKWLIDPGSVHPFIPPSVQMQCHADRRTPYDPHLPSLFDGEEYSKYARLWTR